MRSALLRDPSLIKIVTLYMKLGLVFTLAVLAIYFLMNRSGQADTPRLARLRQLAIGGAFSLLGYLADRLDHLEHVGRLAVDLLESHPPVGSGLRLAAS